MADIIPPAGYRLRSAGPAIEPTPAGLIQSGNIDLNARPIVRNPDGSISTVRSMSFGTDAGEVLAPTVSDDGRIMSEEEAVQTAQQTGRNLGVFNTPDNATAYAERLHNQQAAQYLPKAVTPPPGFTLRAAGATAPIRPTPVPQASTLDVVGQNIAEAGKGIPAGVGSLVGSAITGVGTNLQQSNYDQLALMDRVDRGETVPEMEDPAAYQYMGPEQRKRFRATVQGGVDTPIADLPLVQAGRAVTRESNVFPAAPGYEQSPGRMVGEGLGSVAGGVGVAMIPGAGPIAAPALYTASGSGQAAEQAMQDPNATRQQVVTASLAGAGPGATDTLPLETLIGSVPLPGAKLLAKVPGIVGSVARGGARMLGQGVVEAGQEAAQQVGQNLVAQQVYNPEQDLGEGAAVNAAAGGGTGILAEIGRLIVSAVTGRHGHGVPTESTMNWGQAPQQGIPSPAGVPPAAGVEPVTPAAAPPQGEPLPQGAAPAAVASIEAGEPSAAAGLEAGGDPGAAPLPAPPPDIPALTDAWTQVMTEIGAGTPTPEQSQLRGQLEAEIQAAGGKIPDPLPIIQKARSQQESSLRMGMQRAAEGTQPVGQIIAAENIEADLPAEERIWRDALRVAQGAGGVSMAELRRQMRLSPAQARGVIQRMEAEGLVGPAGANFSKRPWLGAVPTPTAGTQQDPVQVATPMDADLAASRVAEPTPGQAEAGNYQMGHLNWQGMDVSIETPRGGQRTGTDETGAPWSVTMPAHYGYIKTAEGADGDKLDVYLGPDPAAPMAFVVDQIDPDTRAFDEHKVVLGAKDEAEARQLYEAGFSDGRGPARIGAITPMPVDSFRQMIDEWNPGSPLAYEDPAALEAPPPAEPEDLVPDYLAGLDESYEDVPGFDPAPDRSTYWSEQVRQARAKPAVQKSESLLGFIRSRGGLRRADPNVRAALRDARLPPGTISGTGLTPDDAALAAWQAGYLRGEERPDLQAFYDAIEREAQGGETIYPGERAFQAQQEGQLGQDMDRLMHEAGVTLAMSPEEAGRRLAAHERMVDRIRHELPQLPPGVQRLQLEGLTGLSAPDRRPADVDKAMRAAAAALRRIVPQAKVELIDALFSEDGVLQPYGGLSTSDLVVLTAMSIDPARTARHEAIHALRNFGVISNREWAILEAQAPAWRQQFQIDERYAGNQAAGSEQELNEEAVADAYAEWARGGWDGADTRVQRIFRRIQQLLLQIRAAVRRALGRDPDVNDLFAAIESGRIGARGGSVGGTALARAAKMQRYQQAAEETNQSFAAFIDWFAGSKVVDKDGLPQRVFHGTQSAGIDAFDPLIGGSEPMFGPGIYLTESPRIASEYAVGKAGPGAERAPNVLPLYASITNPWDMEATSGRRKAEPIVQHLVGTQAITPEQAADIIEDVPWVGSGEAVWRAVNGGLARANEGHPLSTELVAAMKAAGYDGITHIGGGRRQPDSERHRVWIAFDPPQVKSQFNVGTWGRDTDQIRFALPSQRQQMAATALTTVMGGPKLPTPDDLGWLGKAVLSPYHIAAVDVDFEPVFGTQLEMNERRSRIATTLFRQLEPYFRASTADKVAVNAALEMGRLEKVDYRHQQGPTITAANPGPHKHAVIPPGQSRTLTPRQTQLFRAVRGAMDMAIRMMRNAYLIEQGFGKPGDPKTPGQFRALASVATSAREQQRMLDIAETLDTINQSQQTGYVPFTRYGDWYINVRDVNGVVVHSERVEKGPLVRRRAAQLRQRLEAMYPAGQYKVDDTQIGVDPRKDLGLDKLDFVALGRLAEQGGASQQERDDYESYLREGLSKSGFRSHFITSKNLPGYSQDFERAIADYVMGLSGYLARRATREKLRTAIDMIPRAKRRLKRYAEDYAQYTTTPTEEFQRLRTWMFFASLAGNISSALVNVSQIPIASYPWLSMVSNPARATWELTKASKDVLKAFRPRLAGDALYFDVNALPAGDRAEMQALLDEGTLVPQATIEQMGVAQSRNRKLRGLKKRTGFVVDLLGSMFGAAERFNRMVTALAMLRMMREPAFAARASDILKGNKIAQAKSAAGPLTPIDGARMAVDETQFVQGKVNRQSVMRSYGSVILQFSGFMSNMLQLQARLAGKHGARGKAALGLQLGILLMFGGLFGLPGAETLKSLIEAILGVASGHDVDIEKELTVALADVAGGKDASQLGLLAAEAVRRGVFRPLGVDVSQRIGMGNVTPGQDLGREASAWEHMMSLSPIGQVPARVLQAFQAHQRGDDAAAAVALSPLFLSAGGGNLLRAATMEQGGLRSRAGDMLIPKDKVTPADVALRAIGFQSSHLARAFEQYGMENRLDTAMQQINRNYARAIAIATLQQDGGEVQRLRAEITAYNQGRPAETQIVVSQQAIRNAVGRELEGIGARRRTNRTAEARQQIDDSIPDTTIFDVLGTEGDSK